MWERGCQNANRRIARQCGGRQKGKHRSRHQRAKAKTSDHLSNSFERVDSVMELTHCRGLRSIMQPSLLESMERKSFADMHSSVAQCLEGVGEWGSMLILRDALLGVTRFDQFQDRLGISRNIFKQH